MATRYTTVTVAADQDQDDCLTAAAAEYIEEHPELAGYDLEPRWTDETRETVTLTVPARHLASRIAGLRPATEAAWDLAVDTCIDTDGVEDASRRASAEADRSSALDAWNRAAKAIESGRVQEARDALEEAKALAAEWGDDAQERLALELIANAQ